MKIVNLKDYLENLNTLLLKDKTLAFLYGITRKIRGEIVYINLKEIGNNTVQEILSIINGDFIRI